MQIDARFPRVYSTDESDSMIFAFKRLFGTNGISVDSQFSFLSQQIIILSAP